MGNGCLEAAARPETRGTDPLDSEYFSALRNLCAAILREEPLSKE